MDNYNGNICFIISILLFPLTSLFLTARTRWSLSLVNSFYRLMAVMVVETNKTNTIHSFGKVTKGNSTFSAEIAVTLCTKVMLGNCFSIQRKQYHFTNSFLNYTIGSVGNTARYLKLLKTMGGAFASISYFYCETMKVVYFKYLKFVR